MSAADDTAELIRMLTVKAEHYRDAYLKQRVVARTSALIEARHDFEKLIRELKAHHMDAVECALLDTISQRYNESLNLLMPNEPATVETSGR
jgi:hypothetical protein